MSTGLRDIVDGLEQIRKGLATLSMEEGNEEQSAEWLHQTLESLLMYDPCEWPGNEEDLGRSLRSSSKETLNDEKFRFEVVLDSPPAMLQLPSPPQFVPRDGTCNAYDINMSASFPNPSALPVGLMNAEIVARDGSSTSEASPSAPPPAPRRRVTNASLHDWTPRVLSNSSDRQVTKDSSQSSVMPEFKAAPLLEYDPKGVRFDGSVCRVNLKHFRSLSTQSSFSCLPTTSLPRSASLVVRSNPITSTTPVNDMRIGTPTLLKSSSVVQLDRQSSLSRNYTHHRVVRLEDRSPSAGRLLTAQQPAPVVMSSDYQCRMVGQKKPRPCVGPFTSTQRPFTVPHSQWH
ncbi:MAG: uncharacterized protein KVP18_003270 [Porospora cf. gigantea A]|uniref:uncharacterized protein n=1 Tax=Porospora cf. gigantea A TaxID=2853593 RepID=UPI0035597939|nr:MAG: hypothetical protein KVP18_003270 [Porospora cf. gigantea A]